MRVLVAVHSPRSAATIAEGLRRHGIAVDVAYDGHEAVTRLNLNPYDVVVLDRNLPGVHGDTLCRACAHAQSGPMILMLTAADAPEERVVGLSAGADDCLPKPIHFPELVLRVKALARRRPTAHHLTLRAGDLELDPITGSVTRGGNPIQLTAKERGVLQALLKASPGGLTAGTLLEQVWDENADPFTNTVKVTIGRLRRKLGDPPVVHHTPGIGYRLTTSTLMPRYALCSGCARPRPWATEIEPFRKLGRPPRNAAVEPIGERG